MLKAENLYQPPKVMKYEKDQYPTSTYELDGYTSYSWGNNIPEYNTEIDKSKLSMCWNDYYGTLKLNCADWESQEHNNDDFQSFIINGNTIEITAKAGMYIIQLSRQIQEDGQMVQQTINYPVFIAPNRYKKEDITIENFQNKIDRINNIIDQFNSSPQRQVVLEETEYTPHYQYHQGVNYNYATQHQP